MRELFVKSARASLPEFPYTHTTPVTPQLSRSLWLLAGRAVVPVKTYQEERSSQMFVIIMILLEVWGDWGE